MNAAPIVIILIDQTAPDSPSIHLNDVFSALTDYTAEEMSGQNCRFL